jgi:molybdopterin biosynthesis enzyme
MLGVVPSALPWRNVTLAEATKATSKRQLFRTAKLNADGSATVLPWQGSGDLMHTSEAQAWVRLPMSDAPIAAGTSVQMLPMIG